MKTPDSRVAWDIVDASGKKVSYDLIDLRKEGWENNFHPSFRR
jgi:hypothetical protein